MFVETGKRFIESFAKSRIKNLQFLLNINVAHDVSFQEHCLTDLD